mmetsp:Transcript_3289/g.12721  ORF Transcript_3289/g.12721 Transcript_3289/m.12721 type:complete len:282 (+) Transcript_3289:477-1322(+)
MQSCVWKMVLRLPRRIVPPMCVLLPSGIKMTAGFFVSGSISVECASDRPRTFRAYSITIHCIPRQIPRYGTLFSRAYLAAIIFPSVPRPPKPPGTKMPCAFLTLSQAASYLDTSSLFVSSSKSLASTHNKSSLRSHAMELCSKALVTDKYESPKPVYFPTSAMVTGVVTASHFFARYSHCCMSGSAYGSCSWDMIFLSASCSSITSGTCQILLTSHKLMIHFGFTWQNSASLSMTLCSSGCFERHASMCGDNPAERNAWIECCVGLVFCSPTAPTTGTSDT